MIEQVVRAASLIDERSGHGIDPKVMVDRGHNLLEVHRTFYGVCAQVVGQADRLARSYASASYQSTAGLRPMVSSSFFVDLGRATELAPNNDGNVIEHAMFFQILDESRHALIEFGTVVAHQTEIIAVTVPATEGQRHRTDTRLDQSAGNQQVIVAGGSGVHLELVRLAVAVPLANPGVFLAQVQSIDEFARRKDIESLFGKSVPLGGRFRTAAELVNAFEKGFAILATAEPMQGGSPIEVMVPRGQPLTHW